MGILFFSYLSIKWKRLIRSFFLIILIAWIIYGNYNYFGLNTTEIVLGVFVLWFLITNWLSFIIKPFIIKKEKKGQKKNILTYLLFGYLPLKWKRLIRSILILFILIEESARLIEYYQIEPTMHSSLICQIDLYPGNELEIIMAICLIVFMIISVGISGFFMNKYKKEYQEYYDINDFK